MRRNLDGGVHAAGGRATDQQRDFANPEVIVFLHFPSHILHFFQTGRDQARQAHNVGPFDLGARQNFVARHHHAHVHHVEVIALQNHRHDVFADVMHIAFDRGNDDLAFGFHVFTGGRLQALFFFNVGDQMRHRLLHHAGTFHHLR